MLIPNLFMYMHVKLVQSCSETVYSLTTAKIWIQIAKEILKNSGVTPQSLFLNFIDVISIYLQNSMLDVKFLLQEGLSESEFYGDLVCKFRKIYACNEFSSQFREIILRYIKI